MFGVYFERGWGEGDPLSPFLTYAPKLANYAVPPFLPEKDIVKLCTFTFWIFESPQLTFRLLNSLTAFNSVKDSRACSTFSSVGSDHRVVSAILKLSLRVSKKAVSHPMKRIDWKEVSSNNQASKDFAIQVFNKFQSLSATNGDTENVEDVYSNLIKATEEVALATLPKKKRRSESKPSVSKRVVDARIKLKSISSAHHEAPSPCRGVDLSTTKK